MTPPIMPPLAQTPLPIWVAELDLADPVAGPLAVPPGHEWARVLPRWGGLVGEPVLCPVSHGRVEAEQVRSATTDDPDRPQTAAPLPPDLRVTVTVATRDRPEHLERMLTSLLAPPDAVAVLVVDNAPSDERTEEVVRRIAADDDRMRYVREPRAGLSVARNRALREVDGDVLLFTDDDVQVDRYWVRWHAAAYLDQTVTATSGPAFAARLDKRDELLSESVVSWSKGPHPRRFSLADPPPELPIFPYSPGVLGGGLNFGVRVEAARRLGGFDEALGAGSPTQGGEDCDFLIRLVRSGGLVAYLPDAFVWHHHRHLPGDFERQMVGYGLGLGAYLGKLGADPSAWWDIARRLPAAGRHFARLRRASTEAGVEADQRRSELTAVARGAGRYWMARRAVRRADGHLGDRPLTAINAR